MEKNELIKQIDGNQVMDSRDVAKMISKTHAHLMRDIARYINDMEMDPKLDSSKFFVESSYVDNLNREKPCYLLTKQGCEFVANKLTGKKGTIFTATYVGLFNKYQEEHNRQLEKPSYMIEDDIKRAERWIEERKAYEKAKVKADYFDVQMLNPGLMTITEIAKDYGWSARTMNGYLHDKGVIFKKGKSWVLYQKYADQGYAQYEPFAYDDNKGVHNNLKWTQKGKKFIYDLLKEDNVHPVLERMDLLEG
ncbi:Rha family transcriptional regulator [Limosilactobacillus fermentum]|uniref:phage regulatory protein/antirepressor Ant n=1 Tax=Limosilactobacillus fermentum TaxID=1613 RepID=UPI000DC00EF2|nr:phage regulatory protein/antirepressor Ant [Limosilactobacillus fermentum]RAM09909.1 Rha family transcriptional regulator [Limosilactobacillus fermentum]